MNYTPSDKPGPIKSQRLTDRDLRSAMLSAEIEQHIQSQDHAAVFHLGLDRSVLLYPEYGQWIGHVITGGTNDERKDVAASILNNATH
jgi:hypothetical protein